MVQPCNTAAQRIVAKVLSHGTELDVPAGGSVSEMRYSGSRSEVFFRFFIGMGWRKR
jgi:hypothetical protein